MTPEHLDDDGKALWEQCSWIIDGYAVAPDMQLQILALHIRRELRLESAIRATEADVWRRAIEAAGAAVYSELRVRGASEELAGKIRDAVRALQEPKP